VKAMTIATSTVNAKLSDANKEYKKVVNDAVITRLKSELISIIIYIGMSLS
jgi:hypothetical protein